MLITLPKVGGKIDEDGDIQSIIIDPFRCCKMIEKHFLNFVQKLRGVENTDLRGSFKKICYKKWEWDNNAIIGINRSELNET